MIWLALIGVVCFALYCWWDIERQIKKNIDDMDL